MIFRVVAIFIIAALSLIQSSHASTFDTIASDAKHINTVQNTTGITTESGVTYVCYIDGNLQATVAASSTLGTWAKTVIGTGVAHDAHNVCSLGVDQFGYIWAAWNFHNSPNWSGRLVRSANPYDISSFLPRTITTTPNPTAISYPSFYRAGSQFYLLFRDGTSSDGDVWMYKLSGIDTWSVVGAPIIRGKSLSPTDNAYLGNLYGEANGDLHFIWTARITTTLAGAQNHGVFYARYQHSTNTWHKSSGAALTLPITRLTAENILNDGLADASISNTSLGIVPGESAGSLHAAYNRVVNGHRQIWYAFLSGSAGSWQNVQVTNSRESRLLITPCSPPDPAQPTPCDMEIQGPTMIVRGRTVTLFYLRAADREAALNVYGRPPGQAYAAQSSDGGVTWSNRYLPRDVQRLGGEMTLDTSGVPKLLFQEVEDVNAPLSVWDVTDIVEFPVPFVSASGTLQNGDFWEMRDKSTWIHYAQSISVSLWLRPLKSDKPMAVISKPGEIGISLFTGNQTADGLTYASDKIQILLGDGIGGWGAMWNPTANVRAGEIVHLAVVWNGSTLFLYVNGTLAGSTATPDAYLADLSSNLMIGRVQTIPGAYYFDGWVDIEVFDAPLSAAQVGYIFAAGGG